MEAARINAPWAFSPAAPAAARPFRATIRAGTSFDRDCDRSTAVNANRKTVRRDPGYAGLTRTVPTLPTAWYFDPAQFQLELQRIWQRNWLYVCRSSEIATARSYRGYQIGEQRILLVRGDDGTARAFHNTCRHRGAALCRDDAGRFPAAGIVCPYHSWRYNLQGDLVQASSKLAGDDFEPRDYPLYQLPVTEWHGFLFVALTQRPPPFAASFDLPANRLDDWRMADLVVAHTLRKTMQCNWKVFWENYNECLHCPTVHPKLVNLVPLFGRAYLERQDDPSWQDHASDPDPRFGGGLRRDAQSWTLDGQPAGVPFPGLSEADRKAGHIYLTSVPSVFLVAHLDYVRVLRVRPLGPEETEMSIEFLVLPQTLSEGRDLGNAIRFTDTVMSEDAEICELNQRGLHAAPHQAGVLMPEEYAVASFQNWVRTQLADG
ncbi:MAG: aromatic ring-hydroxylating dioxygenase subunit alpha [Proteobacteria bacterium]|nr:aromatic ring-hydroxylating dioxygenase subunit alpha [Pseudomonadota bacterium]